MKWIATLVIGVLLANVALNAQPVRVRQYGIEAGLSSLNVSSILIDLRGEFWVGTSDAGLYNFERGQFITRTDLNSVTGFAISNVYETIYGSIAIVSSEGTHVYNGSTINPADSYDIPLDQPALPAAADILKVLCWTEGSTGDIWLGTSTGLYSYQQIDSTITRIEDTDGLLESEISGLAVDHSGQLWIGTRSNGVLRYDGYAREDSPIATDLEIRQVCGFARFRAIGSFEQGRARIWLCRLVHA